MSESIHNDVILRAEQVTKIFPGTVALNKVDFNVFRGKVNALVGENGAGKSTLTKILAGVETPTKGALFLEDSKVRIRSFHDAVAHGIGMIHQELNLCPNLNVAENMFVAREITRGRVHIDHKAQLEKAQSLLDRLQANIDPKAEVANLRIGQQQIVEIAKALALDTRILIIDEPTSALSTAEVEVLFKVISDLTGALGHGLSIGVGMALGLKVEGGDQKVFVAMGDGELAEGSNWEAAAAASHHQLDNLLVFVDRNRLQIGGLTVEVMSYEPLYERWEAFGWEVQTINGHDMKAIVESANNAPAAPGKPTCIILDTVKSKGLSFAENRVDYHYWKANQDEMARADKDLAEIEARLTCKVN